MVLQKNIDFGLCKILKSLDMYKHICHGILGIYIPWFFEL